MALRPTLSDGLPLFGRESSFSSTSSEYFADYQGEQTLCHETLSLNLLKILSLPDLVMIISPEEGWRGALSA